METTDRNKDTIRRLTASFNAQEREAFDACYAESIVVHASSGADRTMDHDAHWQEVQGMFRIFPDLHAEIQNMLAEGDRVFVRWTYSGTHRGASGGGIEPTGRHAAWAAWCEYRLAEGRVVEAWNVSDGLHQLRQLGLVQVGNAAASG